MKEYDELRKGGFVSVWVGNFRSDRELQSYWFPAFEKDFGFPLNERDMPEAVVEPGPVEVEKLVHGFSRSNTFEVEVSKAARTAGFGSATTMVVFYNFKYDRRGQTRNPQAPLSFIGAFPFSYP